MAVRKQGRHLGQLAPQTHHSSKEGQKNDGESHGKFSTLVVTKELEGKSPLPNCIWKQKNQELWWMARMSWNGTLGVNKSLGLMASTQRFWRNSRVKLWNCWPKCVTCYKWVLCCGPGKLPRQLWKKRTTNRESHFHTWQAGGAYLHG